MNDRADDTENEGFAMIQEWLLANFGLIFSGARRLVLENRLSQRMRALGVSSHFDYFVMLRSWRHTEEANFLVDEVTNGETYFFREEDQITALLEIQQQRTTRDDLRILSAGCSTGEEAYTLAIRLGEGLAGMRRVVVDAIDIDCVRLTRAKAGRYEERSLRMATPDQRRRYFRQDDDGAFQVREPYRAGVSFRRANLIDATGFRLERPYDAIFCRNVLIYFSEAAFDAALTSLATWLRPGGLLFLGHSESIVGRTPAFRTEQVGPCIVYRRTDDRTRCVAVPSRVLAYG